MKKSILSLALCIGILFSFCLQASAFGQFGNNNYNNNYNNYNNYGENNNRYNGNYEENRYNGTYEDYLNDRDPWNNRYPNRGDEEPTEPTTAAPPPEAISEDGMQLTFVDSNIDYGYRIVIPAECDNDISFAAGTLQSMIVRMTGVLLPIVADTEAETDRELCIGFTNRTKENTETIGQNGFLVYTENERIFLLGNGKKGTINGVCTLLEDQFGCRWYAGDATVIPKHNKLTIPTALKLQESAYFSYTETVATGITSEFQIYNKLTGGAYNTIDESISDTLYLTTCDGTLGTIFASADSYFGNHSDFFALYENKRNKGQLCFSSMGVYNIVMEEVKALLEQNKKTESTRIICLTLQDNDISCQCSACKAANASTGTNTAYYTFINRISSALQTQGYANVKLEASACADAMYPPKSPLADNIIVRLYATQRCYGHTLSESDCKANADFVKLLKTWRDTVSTLYVEIPTANRTYTLGIFPDWNTLPGDLQTLYYLGVDGVCASDPPEADACGDEFRALRIYLYTKLFADPYCNMEILQKEFLEHWYGEKYESALKLLQLLAKNAGDADGHLFIDSTPENTLQMTEKDIETCDKYWKEIIDGCIDGRQQMHTEYSELAWRYWKAYCGVGEFADDKAPQAFRTLVNDLKAAGVTRLNLEQDGFAVGYLSAGHSPQEWTSSNYDVVSPFITIAFILCTLLTLGSAVTVLVFAIRRRIFRFIIPVWLIVVQCFMLPWHNESYLAQEKIGLLLTGALLCGTAAVLTAYAYYAYHPYEYKRRYLLLFLIGFVSCAIPYSVLLSMPTLLGFTREQAFALAFAVLLIHTAVTSVVLLIRFLQYFPLPEDVEEDEEEAEEAVKAEEPEKNEESAQSPDSEKNEEPEKSEEPADTDKEVEETAVQEVKDQKETEAEADKSSDSSDEKQNESAEADAPPASSPSTAAEETVEKEEVTTV